MAFELRLQEGIPFGIKRVLSEQTEHMISLLSEEGDIHRAAHETRKACKRTRAVWRLVRDDIGEKAYRLENETYRDLSRKLSGLRDLTALIEALDKLHQDFPDVAELAAWQQARVELLDMRQVAEKSFSADVLPEVSFGVKQAQKRIEVLKLSSKKFKVVEKGFHRIYRQGHRAMRMCIRKPEAERLHDWRKRVKYFRFHIQLMAPCWPELMGAYGQALHHLSDDLGDHHDLAVLMANLNGDTLLSHQPKAKKQLAEFLEKRQLTLLHRSFQQGAHLYLDRPADFVYRVRQHWELAQRDMLTV